MTTIQELRQKDWVQIAYEEAAGDRGLFIAIYSILDAEGAAPRESNIHPLDSHAYAVIMWNTGRKLGWFS